MKLNNELIEYQADAVEKLRKIKVGALFMEQGTGKTITALELCRLRLEKGKVDRILWLCLYSAKQNIKAEILKQAPVEMLPLITICGIESLSSSVRINSYLLGLVKEKRTFLVVDESLLAKNPYAYRTKNIDRLSELCEYKLILNGTPISKNEADLYAQFHLLDWRILGYKSYWSFAANHIEYDRNIPNKIVRCLNTDVLAEKIAPYSVEIKKDDYLDLPPKRYMSLPFYLTMEQELHYDDIANRLLMQVDEFKPETIYRLFSGLQAVTSGFRVYFEKGKKGYLHMRTKPFFETPKENPRVQKLLEEISNEEKFIIFCKYTREIEDLYLVLSEKYGEDSVTRYDGKIPLKKRDKNLEKFKNKASFLLANKGCAAYSHNLQYCSNIIYFSNDWNLGTRMQSEDRVHRIGQEKKVWITDLFAANTLDRQILDCLRRKENLLEVFKDAIKKQGDKYMMREWVKSGRKQFITDCEDLASEVV